MPGERYSWDIVSIITSLHGAADCTSTKEGHSPLLCYEVGNELQAAQDTQRPGIAIADDTDGQVSGLKAFEAWQSIVVEYVALI